MGTGSAKAWATGPPALYSRYDSSGTASGGGGVLLGVILVTGEEGGNATIYEGEDDQGDAIVSLKGGGDETVSATLGPTGVRYSKLYIDVDGVVYLYYRE